MEKQDVKIVIDASASREDAETLIEFLSKLLNETMGIEAIVSFTIEDKEETSALEILKDATISEDDMLQDDYDWWWEGE